MCQEHKLQVACFGFLSCVGLTLYGCYIHEKDYAQYDLCDADMYSREIITMFSVSQVSWLVDYVNIGIYSDTIKM